MHKFMITACAIWFASVTVFGRVAPYYDIDGDFYSEVRNLLEDHVSRKVIGQVDHPREVREWGPTDPMGQVAGVAVDQSGNPVIFHRGSRFWNHQSFNSTDHFQDTEPIKDPVVVTLDKNTGTVLHSWGANQFFMPHGITIDSDENVWLTDVALHQVFKFTANSEVAALTLGEKLQPGSDNKHFCKPTSVAVTSKGDFFVADGYCNARILHYNADGSFKEQYGHSGSENEQSTMKVPHGLSLNENLGLLCVADREHARIVCINAGLSDHDAFGEEFVSIQNPNHVRMFGIAFLGNTLVGIAGSEIEGIAIGFTADVQQGLIVDEWQPEQGFHNPHCIAVDGNGESLYVSEIGPNRVWKFIMEPSSQLY